MPRSATSPRPRASTRSFALGELSAHAVAAFGAGRRHCDSIEELLASVVRPELGPQATVLVKGSRFMQMERVVTALAAPLA